MLYLWDLPYDIVWIILQYLEPCIQDLDTFSTVFKPANEILARKSSWVLFIKNRFTALGEWDDLEACFDRLDNCRYIYHRLRALNSILDEILIGIESDLNRKFRSVIPHNVSSSNTCRMLAIFRKVVTSLICYNSYSVKRDFFFLTQTRRRVTQGSGASICKTVIQEDGELFSIYFEFSSNSVHFERVIFPVLLPTVEYCRDLDITFKESFFASLLKRIKNRVGYCIKRAVYDPHTLRGDFTLLFQVALSLNDCYTWNDELRNIISCVAELGGESRLRLTDLKPERLQNHQEYMDFLFG